jgi:hypothetical protein
MDQKQAALAHAPDSEPRVWEPPVIEELDFAATAVAYGDVGAPDLAAYSSVG